MLSTCFPSRNLELFNVVGGMSTWPTPLNTLDSKSLMGFPGEKHCACCCIFDARGKVVFVLPFREQGEHEENSTWIPPLCLSLSHRISCASSILHCNWFKSCVQIYTELHEFFYKISKYKGGFSDPQHSSLFKKPEFLPWPCGFAGWVLSHKSERSLVQFSIRAHAWIAGQPSPQFGVWERQTVNVFLAHQSFSPTLCPHLSLSLKISK